jgi:hypothetical protein
MCTVVVRHFRKMIVDGIRAHLRGHRIRYVIPRKSRYEGYLEQLPVHGERVFAKWRSRKPPAKYAAYKRKRTNEKEYALARFSQCGRQEDDVAQNRGAHDESEHKFFKSVEVQPESVDQHESEA